VKKIAKYGSLLAVPMTGVLVVNNHMIVLVVDSFGGAFYKAYEIFDLTVLLEVSQRKQR